jgi:hypothetical protein
MVDLSIVIIVNTGFNEPNETRHVDVDQPSLSGVDISDM